MSEKRFNSKVDTWIALLIMAVALMDVAFIVIFAMSGDSPASKTGAVIALIGVFVLLMWLAFRTYYAVDKDTLRVVSGPFRWRIPLADIQSVTPTRSLWSSPAMSIDRLRIAYGKGGRIMVSPADKQGFLNAIGHNEN
ncbi:MAG: PH domain-containing protein [Woeseiaceae bacterium]